MRFAENHFTQRVGNFCTDYHRALSLFMFIQCDTLVLQVCVFMNFAISAWKV